MNTGVSLSTIPRLRGLPLIGNLLDVRHDFLTLLLRLSRECGNIGIFRIGQRSIVFLNSTELVHAVLVEHAYDFEKTPNMHTYMGPMVGIGGQITSLILSASILTALCKRQSNTSRGTPICHLLMGHASASVTTLRSWRDI